MSRKPHIKLADDASFEQNFFQLAFAYVRDKIPNLLDYMLGFEVVNKNDEGTQAIGLFKFDVSGRELFVPVFYKNGELKGAELLYNKNQDRFVPNKENWVDALLNTRPEELGAPAELPRGAIMQGMQSGGDLSQIYNPTSNTKLSMDKMQAISLEFDWSLPAFLKQADCRFAETYTRTLMSNPLLHKLAAEAYGSDLYEALKSCKEAEVEQISTEQVPEVEVIDSNTNKAVMEHLNDDEKRELISEGVVLKDNRKDGGRIPYKITTPMILNASNSAGVHDILLKGGKFLRAVLMPSMSPVSDSYSSLAEGNKQLLIPMEGSGNPVQVDSAQAYAAAVEDDAAAFTKFLDGLKPATTAKGKPRSTGYNTKDVSHCVFIEADGSQAAGPMILEPALDYEGSKTYAVSSAYRIHQVVISAAYRRMKIVDNTLYVPETAKLKQFNAPEYGGRASVILGDSRDIDSKIKGLFDEVKVSKDRSGFRVTVNGAPICKEADRRDAYVRLVTGVGMSIPAAKQALKSAAELLTATYTFSKQSAPPFDPGMMAFQGMPQPNMGMNPQLGVQEQYPQAETMSVTSGQPGNVSNQNIMDSITGMSQTQPTLNQGAVDKIMQSAQAGDRNVFDVANISELINRADIDTPLDQYMTDLSLSLDRLGRIYFLMLFHGDKFAERFSQEDLPSMEESVRNTFVGLGELILKLKERKIEADSGSAVETDLNQMV